MRSRRCAVDRAHLREGVRLLLEVRSADRAVATRAPEAEEEQVLLVPDRMHRGVAARGDEA